MKLNRYQLSRRSQVRNPLPVVVVVCDDRKTAVAYFEAFKREIKSRVALEIVKAPHHGATPDAIVSEAIKRREALEDTTSKDDTESRSAVWALIDLEAEPTRQTQSREARQKAEQHNVKVALSKPCFEVWVLAHLADTGEEFQDCNAVVKRVRVEWKSTFGNEFPNKKAQADYSKLIPRHQAAIERCARRSPRDPSWTEIHKVFTCIRALSEGKAV